MTQDSQKITMLWDTEYMVDQSRKAPGWPAIIIPRWAGWGLAALVSHLWARQKQEKSGNTSLPSSFMHLPLPRVSYSPCYLMGKSRKLFLSKGGCDMSRQFAAQCGFYGWGIDSGELMASFQWFLSMLYLAKMLFRKMNWNGCCSLSACL